MTIKDIAEMAEVSISTVSKIVNNKDVNINPETRNRVLKIVKDYNYVPYGSVKPLSDAKTFVLGVLLKTVCRTNLFLNGVIAAAQQQGYSIMIYDSADDISTELKNITSLCKNHVDGVLWNPVSKQSLEFRRHFEEQNIEICLLEAPEGIPSYYIDYEAIGYQATQALLQYNHRKPGCLTKENSRRSRLVLEGFRRCLFDNNIAYSDDMKLPVESQEWYKRILSHIPTGVVSSHYDSSMILMEQLGKLKFQVPYDLSLISLRDDIREDIRYPGISSMKIPYFEFGSFVCERLIEQCEKRKPKMDVFHLSCPLENTLSLGAPFTSRSRRIVVVGSINIDVTLNVSELPQPGKTISTNKHSVTLGGKGANQAVGVAKLDNEVALIGRVGNDYDSTLVYTCMDDHHIDTQGIQRDIQAETGKAYIHVQNDGESMITILAGANQNLSSDDITLNDHLFEHSEYCLLQTEVPEATVMEAAIRARKHGTKTILKPAAICQISRSLMQYIDIFVPNKKEAEILCPDVPDIEGKAEAFINLGAKTVIITLGHHGCYIRDDSFCGFLDPAEFLPVDTTGAADAFISTLAVYLVHGYSIVKAAKIASYAAGFCVSRQGVIPALIDRNSLETYIARREPELLA